MWQAMQVKEDKMSRDIIVHYDEDAGKLICSTVEHRLTASLLAGALPLEMPIANIKNKGADEAERILGASLFALIDIHSKNKIGLRDYKSMPTEWENEYADELARKAAQGDAAAKYELAMHKVADGLRSKSRSKMNEADLLLREAASLGNDEATEYVAKMWPVLKERSDSSFK
jgi:hypothetical protein